MFKDLELKIKELLQEMSLSLYSFRVKSDYGISKIIEVLVDGENLNSNNLELIHHQIRERFDELVPDDYYLEVSSAGAERPINSKEELIKQIGNHIYLVSPQFKGTGDLVSFDGEEIVLEIRIKNIKKQIKIKYKVASQMRTAVRV
ncbi:MAG: ribosome maturation factor RimP [Acholeplasmataceae bacterium]|jgi:ribosome maturation factor RimP